MTAPILTLGYLAALGALYAGFALAVVALRARFDVPFGDGGHQRLHQAIRVHGNFAEWVPFIALLVGGLELLGEPGARIHLLMGSLLGARVLHAVGLFSPVRSAPYMVGRIAGALATWLVLVAASALLAVRL